MKLKNGKVGGKQASFRRASLDGWLGTWLGRYLKVAGAYPTRDDGAPAFSTCFSVILVSRRRRVSSAEQQWEKKKLT